jgi:hypothetical protein
MPCEMTDLCGCQPTLAVEVATFLATLFGSADWAEEVMDFTLRQCSDPDPSFWNDVRQATAQIRG